MKPDIQGIARQGGLAATAKINELAPNVNLDTLRRILINMNCGLLLTMIDVLAKVSPSCRLSVLEMLISQVSTHMRETAERAWRIGQS